MRFLSQSDLIIEKGKKVKGSEVITVQFPKEAESCSIGGASGTCIGDARGTSIMSSNGILASVESLNSALEIKAKGSYCSGEVSGGKFLVNLSLMKLL